MNFLTQLLVYGYIVPAVFCFISMQVLFRTELFKNLIIKETGKTVEAAKSKAESKCFSPILNIFLSILILIIIWKGFKAVVS